MTPEIDMQYLLAEHEFRALTKERTAEDLCNKEELLALCKLAAMKIVLPHPNYEEGRVHGCVLEPKSTQLYCGGCPSIKVCPYENKTYGK